LANTSNGPHEAIQVSTRILRSWGRTDLTQPPSDDTPDTLAYPQLAEVTEGLFLSLADLAQSGFDAT
jgi:hypothetical protein